MCFYNIHCGAKGSRDSDPFHIKPKAHAKEEEMPMPRRKKCPRTNKRNPNCQDILPRTTLSSAPVLGRSKSRKGKAPRRQRQSP